MLDIPVSHGYTKGMTAQELRQWRTEHGYTQQGLADALGVIRLTVTRWESGTRAIPTFLELALQSLDCQTKREKGNDNGMRVSSGKNVLD